MGEPAPLRDVGRRLLKKYSRWRADHLR